MHIKTLFSALTSLTYLDLGRGQASLASTLGFDKFGLSSASCCFASQTCLDLGIIQASLASALGFDRLLLYSPLRYRKVHWTFLHIARYAPSLAPQGR